MQPYDIESVVLGLVLKYGKDAALHVLPQLSLDKFVFDFDGTFGADHSIVWGVISDTFLTDKQNPTYVEIAAKLPAYTDVLRAYVDRIDRQYKIYSLDIPQLVQFAELIDKQGIVYNVAAVGNKVAGSITDVQHFMHTVNSISDIEQWATNQLSDFQHIMSGQSRGYTHISEVVDRVKVRWDQQFKGEILMVPDCGLPVLVENNLFPMRKMSVVHGLSSSGKSTLVFQVNLGTAIGLKAEGRKGCVAINSLEMEDEDLVERMVSILAHIDVTRFMHRTMTPQDMGSLFTWADFVATLPIFIDGTNFITTSAMEYRASGLHVSEHGPVIQLSSDYGELFRDEGPTEEQRMNSVFRNQFHLSRLTGASVIAISQSTPNSAVSGKTYIAGPDGTRYSRGILHAADVVAELWNPVQMEASGRTVVAPEGFSTAHPWLFLQKFRGGKAGAAIPLGWRAETTTFFDMSLAQTPGQEIVYTNLEDAMKGPAW